MLGHIVKERMAAMEEKKEMHDGIIVLTINYASET